MKSHRLNALSLPLFMLTLPLAVGCAESSGTNDLGENVDESVATAQAELTNVPAGVLCIRVVTGSTTKNFSVTSGASSVKLDLGQLPVGWLTTSATAYNEACPSGGAAPTASPSWVSDSSYVVVSANAATIVPIVLRPALSTSASVDFRPSPSTIAAGRYASYAVTPDGSAWIWGYDAIGVAGLGGGAYIPKPYKISSLSNVKDISTGTYHACALLNDGTVRCWGWNELGQLGDGTEINRATPVAVSGVTSVTAIASGDSHVCAIVTDGSLRCWGNNAFGQLGVGTFAYNLTPVSPGLRAVAVSAGSLSTCIIGLDRRVSCAGDNRYGQLGNGSTSPSDGYFHQISTGGGFASIALGGHSAFALRSDNKVYAWGANFYGQLGDGTTSDRSVPAVIEGLTGATQISVGSSHACALIPGGSVECWGRNSDCRLGNGNTDDSYVPTPVLNLTNFVQISVSAAHSCGRTNNGDAYCWGAGNYGQIGDSLLATAAVPSRVMF